MRPACPRSPQSFPPYTCTTGFLQVCSLEMLVLAAHKVINFLASFSVPLPTPVLLWPRANSLSSTYLSSLSCNAINPLSLFDQNVVIICIWYLYLMSPSSLLMFNHFLFYQDVLAPSSSLQNKILLLKSKCSLLQYFISISPMVSQNSCMVFSHF